jgi:hypothetical protein
VVGGRVPSAAELEDAAEKAVAVARAATTTATTKDSAVHPVLRWNVVTDLSTAVEVRMPMAM